MKPQHLALTTAAALVAGAALVKWLLADGGTRRRRSGAPKTSARARGPAKLKRKKPWRGGRSARGSTAAKRLQQNNALAVAYGGSQEAVDVAARALRAAEAAARERLDAALQGA